MCLLVPATNREKVSQQGIKAEIEQHKVRNSLMFYHFLQIYTIVSCIVQANGVSGRGSIGVCTEKPPKNMTNLSDKFSIACDKILPPFPRQTLKPDTHVNLFRARKTSKRIWYNTFSNTHKRSLDDRTTTIFIEIVIRLLSRWNDVRP